MPRQPKIINLGQTVVARIDPSTTIYQCVRCGRELIGWLMYRKHVREHLREK